MKASMGVDLDTRRSCEIRQLKGARPIKGKATPSSIRELDADGGEGIQYAHSFLTNSKGGGEFEPRVFAQCSVERFAKSGHGEIGLTSLSGAGFQQRGHARDAEIFDDLDSCLVACK